MIKKITNIVFESLLEILVIFSSIWYFFILMNHLSNEYFYLLNANQFPYHGLHLTIIWFFLYATSNASYAIRHKTLQFYHPFFIIIILMHTLALSVFTNTHMWYLFTGISFGFYISNVVIYILIYKKINHTIKK